MINGLVGVAIGAMMNQRLRELQERPEMENLYWSLAALPDPLIDASTAMEVEMDGVFVMFPQIKDVATTELTPEQWNVRLWEFIKSLSSLTPLLGGGDTAKDWRDKLMEGVGVAVMVTALSPRAKTDLEAIGWSKERLATMAPAQIILLHISEVYQELRDATFKWFHVPYWQAQTLDEEKEVLRGGKVRREIIPLAALLLPAVSHSRFATLRTSRDMAAMQTVEAVRAYSAEHEGKLPAKLEDITKCPVPLDPTKGTLFDYRVDGKTFTLESPAPASRQKSDGLRYIVTLAERTKDTPKAGFRSAPAVRKSKVEKLTAPDPAEIKQPANQTPTGAGRRFKSCRRNCEGAFQKPGGGGVESSRRSKSNNNLRHIAIAMHNYADSNKTLPPPAIVSKDGKPLLSWRVALLPYLENQALYDKFHLDQPWNSEHNKKLIAEMPDVYRSPTAKALSSGKTVYLLPRGRGTMFESAEGARFSEVKDGLSTTMMLVEANAEQAVEWTKPQDVEIDPADPFQKLLGLRGDVFLAGFGDAAVRALSRHMDKENLKAMFTPAGGESVR